jgi:membrane-bound lytic murein transglycosylase D
MFKGTIRRALGRRKIETVTLTAIAATFAIGLAKSDSPVATTALVAPAVQYLAEATGDVTREPSTPATATSGLPNLQHARVDSWIKRFTTDQRGSFATYLKRMTRYEDMITEKLADRGMPKGLIYLAMIESGFNPTAKSPVSATGLWQFMTPTAKEYGLTVTRKIDERKSAARSTDAALEYLGDLHKRFGSWYLAAAAYNTGQGRVARVMKQVTGSTKGTDADYYRIAHRLPRETREYVPKMIAAARIGADPAKYGFSATQ